MVQIQWPGESDERKAYGLRASRRGTGAAVFAAARRRRHHLARRLPRPEAGALFLQSFSALAPQFEAAGAAVLGVSADPVKAQEAFKRKYRLTIPLASDERHAMLTDYGVWAEKAMYGRRFMGIERTTFLIGPDGRIARVWRKVRVDGHADEVLAAVRAL
jgi:peroxiredoxin Q/BCP